jgi:arylsulfatase A
MSPLACLRLILVVVAILSVSWRTAQAADEAERPNVVIVFADDLAYADIGCFGAEGYKTPHIDRLAAEGRRFTSFYVPQAVCSASRAGLLTGCYPNRIGILGALGPSSQIGISADELTLGEMFQSQGYRTAAFGKWHLGHKPASLPLAHGFDAYYGLPYSNDMWPKHPENPRAYPPLPLIDGNKTIETDPDQTQLTTNYTRRAVEFIEQNHDKPFFVYLAHSMPHVPLFVSDKFEGTTERGLFGDVIAEIDWSVGQIREVLEKHKLDRKTLVIFTSDNGPWLSYGDHAGSAGPLREGKGTSFEGGVREPTVMWYPGQIPAGTECDEPAMTIDLLPTLADWVGAELPTERKIDGLNIRPLITGGPDEKTPHDALYFYWGGHLEAVRSGPWKLHLPHSYRTLAGRDGGTGGIPTKYQQAQIGLSLYNLDDDIGETKNMAQEHPEVVEQLMQYVERARSDLGDTATKQKGTGVRPAGRY